jgi:capsular polysaccharide biosynthesis protein
MRIINISDGINIKYNHHEQNIETVFGLNDDNTIIQKFTFISDIHPDNQKLQDYINEAKIIDIDKGYLFYSFRYQISFAHFITQTVPKLKDYVEKYIDYKLLIPEQHYNIITKNILKLCNIDENMIYILRDKTIYNIYNFEKGNYYNSLPDNYTNDHIDIYKRIRNGLYINNNLNSPFKKIYLKRDGKPNSNYGNSETGIIRSIHNENELIEKLKFEDFEIITLGDKDIYEKRNLLKNAKIVITPIGANCINFLFSEYIENFIFLSNSFPLGYDWYKNILTELNNKSSNAYLLEYPCDRSVIDHTNVMNSPYSVDINAILSIVNSI